MISKYSPRWFTALSSYFPIIFATVCTCWVDVELMQESLSFYSVRIKQSWGGEWRPRPAQLTSFLPLLMWILLFRTIPIISTGHGGRKETDRRAVEEEQEQGLTTTLRLAPTTTTTTTRWGQSKIYLKKILPCRILISCYFEPLECLLWGFDSRLLGF